MALPPKQHGRHLSCFIWDILESKKKIYERDINFYLDDINFNTLLHHFRLEKKGKKMATSWKKEVSLRPRFPGGWLSSLRCLFYPIPRVTVFSYRTFIEKLPFWIFFPPILQSLPPITAIVLSNDFDQLARGFRQVNMAAPILFSF